MAKIYKFSGTGNTFLLVDLRHDDARQAFFKKFKNQSRAHLARQLCNPFQSLGADGLLYLENSKRADLKWDFYNADGSRAEMCGNATRCVALYEFYYSRKAKNNHLSIATRAGIVNVTVLNKKSSPQLAKPIFQVQMPAISEYLAKQKIPKTKDVFDFVNTGVPHSVIRTSYKSLDEMLTNVDKLAEIVNKVRSLSRFKKYGTNVTFYTQIHAKNDNSQSKFIQSIHANTNKSNRISLEKFTQNLKINSTILSLTFERGVPLYTQACGTGAVAAAFCSVQALLAKKSAVNKSLTDTRLTANVDVSVPGGKLVVKFDNFYSPKDRPHLIGPANFIAAIDIREIGDEA